MPLDTHLARRRLEQALGYVAYEGNSVERLRNGVQIFPAMVEAIRAAERSVDLLTFVYWTGPPADQVAEALTERARAGVRVRLVLDAFGARHMRSEHIDALEEAGALVHKFRDVLTGDADSLDSNHRTHRKVMVVDGRVGFTGGVGIAEEWAGDAKDETEWRDDHFRVTGPVVEGLRAAFLDDWLESGHPLFEHESLDLVEPPEPTGDTVVMAVKSESERGVGDVALAKRLLLSLAEDHVRLTTAYFSPNDEMARWLMDCARGGARVDVLTPREHIDKVIASVNGEKHYEELLEAGVNIFQYGHTMLHAKIMTVDGRIADVGSANFNTRSMRQDEEIDLVVFDEELVATLDADFAEDLQHATPVDLQEWRDRGVLRKVAEAATGLIDRYI